MKHQVKMGNNSSFFAYDKRKGREVAKPKKRDIIGILKNKNG